MKTEPVHIALVSSAQAIAWPQTVVPELLDRPPDSHGRYPRPLGAQRLPDHPQEQIDA